MPRVFVGIPTINRPDLVKLTINSLRDQSFADFRAIVSDNGSAPGVLDSIGQYLTEINDPRFQLFQQPENLGEYGQGRYFLKEAEGADYFVILHDDDLIHPEYLQCAVNCLDEHLQCAVYIADPVLIDISDNQDPVLTQQYLAEHGRLNSDGGIYDIIQRHFDCGFTPISGTVFRFSEIQKTGFVDKIRQGNYPFESDVFLRLGDIGAQGWHERKTLLSVRFHNTSMRHYIQLLENHKAVTSMIALYEAHSYKPAVEKHRKVHLARLYRALAFIQARQGLVKSCRKSFINSFHYYRGSAKWWLSSPLALCFPQLLRFLLPKLPQPLEAPTLTKKQ